MFSVAAVDACRWTTLSVPCAPYVTSIPWIDHYGCFYVGHGDDITSDASGEDCYRYVKSAGRFAVFKRTPSISTTDLVGRMLLCTKTHHIKSFYDELNGNGQSATKDADAMQRVRDYASDESGRVNEGAAVWIWQAPKAAKIDDKSDKTGAEAFKQLVSGKPVQPLQRIVYVDGGFDLFSSGHIEFLKRVYEAEKGQAYIVAGVHDDEVINHWKGLNYPIMNIFERGLCVLQCKYVNAVVFGAPFSPSRSYLGHLPPGKIAALYHGPTTFIPLTYDPYSAAKEMGIYKEIGEHPFSNVNAGEIVERILKGRKAFEDRQRKKGIKAIGEEATGRREQMQREQAEIERQRSAVS